MMTKTDAICYAPYGIRVNAVHPGSTKTGLFMQAAEAYPAGKDAYLAMIHEKHPLTLGEPVDVANCVMFLASDEARFVTGTSLVCTADTRPSKVRRQHPNATQGGDNDNDRTRDKAGGNAGCGRSRHRICRPVHAA
jgi:NAD(P)-dependent dehydrogenase (short-subunit alcohol dehydrogenase family)